MDEAPDWAAAWRVRTAPSTPEHSGWVGAHLSRVMYDARFAWRVRGTGSRRTRAARRVEAGYLPVGEGYVSGRGWLLWVEVGTAIVSGVLGGMQPATEDGCRALLIVNLCAAVGLLLVVALWPFNTLRDAVVYGSGSALNIAVSGLLVADAEVRRRGMVVGFVGFAEPVRTGPPPTAGGPQPLVRRAAGTVAARPAWA